MIAGGWIRQPTLSREGVSKIATLSPRSMKHLAALLVVAGFAAPLLPAGGANAQFTTITAAQAQADFDVLHRALAEAHGGYARYAPRAEVDRRFALHRQRLSRDMTVGEFAGIVSEAIAELRDGHLRLEPDTSTMRGGATAKIFPLRLFAEGDDLAVLFNDTPSDSTIQPGMTLLSINGRSVSQLRALLLPKISADGFIETGKRRRLASGFATLYWMFVDQGSTYVVQARDAAGRIVTDTLEGVLGASIGTGANPVNRPMIAGLAKIDTTRGNITLDQVDGIHRLRIRAFANETFAASLDSVFRLLRERNADRLILDLRGNGGGVDQYGAALVSHFTDRPFRYFDHIRLQTVAPSFATWLPRTFESVKRGTEPSEGTFLVRDVLHPGVGEQQPSAEVFRGRLVVLIDGGSFSTTADVAAQLRSWGRATFVGEETAGAYEGNTSGLNADVILPTSKLKLRIMMYDYWNAVKKPASPGRGTIPDHVVTPTIADRLAGRDPVLARAVSIIR